MSEIHLDGTPLTPRLVERVARRGEAPTLSDDARRRIADARDALERAVAEDQAVYGATTGVGTRDGQRIPPEAAARFQTELLRSHAIGVGAPAPEDVVRAMIVVRTSQLAMGRSGAGLPMLETMTAMLARRVTPRVPSLGSVGASDLAPLAHAALPLIGEGAARFEGRDLEGADALGAARIERPALGGRDALAWINGPAFAVGRACLALVDAERILSAAEAGAALTMAALDAHKGSFAAELIAEKPHRGALQSAERLWSLLPHAHTTAREPLSIRCLPYVLGAGRDALEALAAVVEVELASPADNPILRDGAFFGGGATFDTHRLAQLLDGLADAVTAIAATAERRIARLCDPATNGLGAFLIADDEGAATRSGTMIMQYTAVSLVARMRSRGPANALGAPTCNGFEDAVSLAPLSVERLAETLEDLARVVAIESVVAARAITLRGRPVEGTLAASFERTRSACPFGPDERALGETIERFAGALRLDPAPAQASCG